MLVFNGYCSWKSHFIKICGSRWLCFLKSSTQFSVPSTSLKKSVCWNLYNKFPSFSLSLTCSGSIIACGIFIVNKWVQNLLKHHFWILVPKFMCALTRVFIGDSFWQHIFIKLETCLAIFKMLLTWISLGKIATFLLIVYHLYLEGSDKVFFCLSFKVFFFS